MSLLWVIHQMFSLRCPTLAESFPLLFYCLASLYQHSTPEATATIMAEVHGSCDPAFNSVRDFLQQKLADGPEVGASLCINIDGRDVLDLWGGYADASKIKLWDRDTITGVWSCTKVITCLKAHILVNRGLLDVNEKVTTYWPEFAANGKENMKVLHILSHSSGLPAFDEPITIEEMQDVEKSAQRLAGQAP